MHFSIRNAVYVALVQVAVIVLGVLACGLADKIAFGLNSPDVVRPWLLVLVLGKGFLLLVIPLIWISLVSFL